MMREPRHRAQYAPRQARECVSAAVAAALPLPVAYFALTTLSLTLGQALTVGLLGVVLTLAGYSWLKNSRVRLKRRGSRRWESHTTPDVDGKWWCVE